MTPISVDQVRHDSARPFGAKSVNWSYSTIVKISRWSDSTSGTIF